MDIAKGTDHSDGLYTLAIENCDLEWVFPLNMVIFHGYVNVYQRVMTFQTFTQWFLYKYIDLNGHERMWPL